MPEPTAAPKDRDLARKVAKLLLLSRQLGNKTTGITIGPKHYDIALNGRAAQIMRCAYWIAKDVELERERERFWREAWKEARAKKEKMA